MKVYILGICGTFMASLAVLAKELGHEVAGCDEHIYPPMSDVLDEAGITVHSGYHAAYLDNFAPDHVIVGNAMSRGNPLVEHILNHKVLVHSGPSWLHAHVLKDKKVIAIAGTHGKTTTTSMVCHILEKAGHNPGFLIGGVSMNMGVSARLTDSEYFVIEADEYDTSFFDKRAKFVHYFPYVALINNIEYDHADIYPNVDAIIEQFHQMVRVIPDKGALIIGEDNQHTQRVVNKGTWCDVEVLDDEWSINHDPVENKYVFLNDVEIHRSPIHIHGAHNARNVLAAAKVCERLGIGIAESLEYLMTYEGAKRRLENIFENPQVRVYDDFAHHPTAIKHVIKTVRDMHPDTQLHAIIEFGSRSMQRGVHAGKFVDAVEYADFIYCKEVDTPDWNLQMEFAPIQNKAVVRPTTDELLTEILDRIDDSDQTIILMRNTGFEYVDQKLVSALKGDGAEKQAS